MKIHFFLFFTAVLLGTAEAGLRHVYENLYAFLAYRFELENIEESKRIIGVKCASADYETHKCLPGNPMYKRCVGTATVEAKGGRMTDACGLREFLSHISGNKGEHLKGEPYDGADLHNYRDKALLGAGLENAADFDVNNAARNMYEKRIGDSQSPPWCKVKDGKKAYFPSFERIAARVGDIKAKMSVEELENNKSKFQRLDACADNVNVDRRADMSKYLIPELKKAAKGAYSIISRPYPGERRLFLYPKTIDSISDSVQGLGDNKESAFRTRKNALDNALASLKKTDEAQRHQLDSFAMLRIGAFESHHFPLRLAKDASKVEVLDRLPGWIGSTEGSQAETPAALMLGGRAGLTKRARYPAYYSTKIIEKK